MCAYVSEPLETAVRWFIRDQRSEVVFHRPYRPGVRNPESYGREWKYFLWHYAAAGVKVECHRYRDGGRRLSNTETHTVLTIVGRLSVYYHILQTKPAYRRLLFIFTSTGFVVRIFANILFFMSEATRSKLRVCKPARVKAIPGNFALKKLLDQR